MNPENPWYAAKRIKLEVSPDIHPGFDIGFDENIPEETRAEIRAFISWVENHFYLPITLWVNFEYKHYLFRRDRKRVGYLFYWSDFDTYPVFNQRDNIPIIRLPVRTEYSTIEEILASFIEAITCYFAWLTNTMTEGFDPDESHVEEILQEYLSSI